MLLLSLQHTDRVYKDFTCRKQTVFHCLVLFPLHLVLVRTLFLSSSHSHITHTYILELRTRNSTFVKRGRSSVLYIISYICFLWEINRGLLVLFLRLRVCVSLPPPHLSKPPFIVRVGFVGPVWQCLVNKLNPRDDLILF